MMKKRILAALLCICMAASLLPTAAWAQEDKTDVCGMQIRYDGGLGSVFSADGAVPAGNADEYVFSETWNEATVGSTVRLLIDPERVLDWDHYNQTGEMRFIDPRPIDGRGIYVSARYEISEGNWFDGYVVENNVAVQEGFTFADGVLSFTPQTGENMEFDVQWSADEYDYVNFHATAACPILLEFSWFGYGEPDFSAVSTENKYVAQNSSRAKVLVPADAESFTLTWADSYHVRRVRQNGHDEVMYPDGSYLVELSEYDAENPDTHYCYTELEFTDDNFDGEIRLSYDQGWGSVFCSLGDEAPAKTVENYVWNEGVFSCLNNGVPQQVNLLIDEERGIDWDVFNDTGEIRFRDPGSRDDRELFIFVQYENEYGDWIDEEAYGWGNINNNFFSYEDGVFSFTPKNHSNYYISVYWCEEDYQFGSFLGTENYPILVNVNWNDNGSIWLNNENNGGEVHGNNRLRTSLSADAEYCEICWGDGDRVRCIEIDGGQTVWFPEGNEYRIPLTQKNDDGSPRNWYDVHVEFLGDNWNSELSLDYDDGNGLVFMTVGDDLPQGLGEELLLSWWRNDARRSFADANDGTQLPVYLLLDQTRALDGEEYDRSGCIEYVDPWMDPNDRDLNIVARYEKPDGSWFDGPVVEHGAAVAEGFAFANNILAFAPQTAADIQLDVYWTREDYEFNRFGGTEEKPIIVSFDWNEHGSVKIPAGIADEDTFVQQSRAKVRVPIDTESLTFTWETETALKCARVDRNDRQEEIHPHEGKLVLPLDETWENGYPKDYYHLNFDFADENEYNHMLGVYYNDGLGSAFVALGGGQPEPTGEYYTSGEDVCFLKDGALQTVRILIDPTRALDWGRYNDTGEFVFTDPGQADDREINIIARFNDEDGNWFDEFVVRNGAAAQDGFTYQNNVLTFTPRSGFGVDINVFWTKQEYDFETFGPTEEKPIFVYINHRDCPELTVTPNENVESMTMYDQTKLRVAEGAGDLTLSWSEPYHVRHARLRLENGWEFHEDEIWDNNYEFWTGYQDDQGNPFHYYEIELEFDNDFTGTFATHYNEWGGSVFCALGDRTPAATVEDYILSGWDGETSFYENGAIQTIRLLLDPTKELDWEAWERSEIRFIDVDGEGKSVFVRASWRDNGGYWHNDVLIENGACVYPYVQYENNVLTFTPENGCRVNFEIYWTQADYDYSCFGGDWEKPVVVDVGWRNDGEIRLADDIPEEDVYAQPDHARFKLRLPADAETVTFTWDADKRVSRLEADANRSFDRVDERNIEGNSYTLHLNPPAHENDEYADYYWLNFEFDDEWNYELIPHYDANGGSVFFALDEEPQATPQYYSPDNWNKSFRSEYGVGTVWMLLDETKALDWDAWQDGNGEIRFVDPWDSDDRAISVVAHYRRPNGEWVDEPLVEYGVAVDESIVTFEDNMLIFQPESGYEVELNVYWTRADYDFDRFGGTEEKPIIVKYDWNEFGSVNVPEGIPEEDVFVQGDRARVRVPLDAGSLRFDWNTETTLQYVRMQTNDGDREVQPENGQFTLALDQTGDNGEPRDYYDLHFEFAGDYEWNDMLRVNYDDGRGSAFVAFGDGQPTPDGRYFRNGEELCFRENGALQTVRLLIDETRAVDWENSNDEQLRFKDPEPLEDRFLSVILHYREENLNYVDEFVVANGEATDFARQHGVSFENGVLTFTPQSGYTVTVDIYWTERDYIFESFLPTDDKPIYVNLNHWGNPEIVLPEGEGIESMTNGERSKLRISETTYGLTVSWSGLYHVREWRIRLEDGTEYRGGDIWDNEFSISLSSVCGNGERSRYYDVELWFDDEWNYELIPHYDANGGSVFFALDEEPQATPQYYSPDNWNKSFRSEYGVGTVWMLLDETKALDWDAWQDGNGEIRFVDPWDSDDRAISVVAHYRRPNGEWVDEPLVEYGVAVDESIVTFEDNMLIFQPESGYDVELNVYWTRADYDFDRFGGTEEKPVVVHVDFWGSGEVFLPEGFSAESEDVFVQDSRFRLRVGRDVEELTFRWQKGKVINWIQVEGAGENGDWLQLDNPQLDAYTLRLDQTNWDGEPKDWYQFKIEFDYCQQDGLLTASYGSSEGSVFWAVGDGQPQATPAQYFFDGWDENRQGVSYVQNGEIVPVHLLLDETKAIDWDFYDRYGEVRFVDPMDISDRSISVTAHYRTADGWFDGPVVEYGQAVQEGFRFENNVLSFTPENLAEFRVEIYWNVASYEYSRFHGTEGKPVVVEANWWGEGEIPVPDVPEEDYILQDGRFMIRVPITQQSVTFTWDDKYLMKHVNVRNADGSWRVYSWPEGNSFTLPLDQTWDGEPGTFYRVIFDFADPNDDRSAIIANYDQSMGSVFWALDDAVPAANADSYLFSHVDDWASFVKDGQIHPVRLLLDETRAIDWDAWDDGELKFIDPWQVENRAIFVRARVITDDWERMETVVANGAVTAFGRQEGYAFENNVLTFTPKTRDDVELEIYWNRPDYDFACFGGTEDKPVLVSVYWWGEGEILTPEGIPEADVHRQEGRFRVRVPMQTEELTFRWDEQYEMGMIHVRVNGNWVELGPNGQHSYTLTLDQTDDNGWPETWYELNFDFAENRDYTMAVNYRQSEGSVFVGVNAPAAHDGAHYCNGLAGFGYEDESGDMQIGKVYFTLDPTVSIPYFGGGEYSEYPLPAWEGYSPTIWMGYRQADGWYFDGMIVKDGVLTDAAVQRGFTFDGNTLVFTPETKNPIEVHVFWCADDEGYWEFRGTEAKPVEIELWQAMSQPLTLPGDIPAEDVFTYQGAEHIFRKYRVAQNREYFEISWPLWLEEDPNAIAYIEIECDNGESDAFWVTDASSYRLMLDQTYENGEPVQHYCINVWRGYVSKYNLALVTDGGEPEDGGFIQQIYDAGKAWCEQNEMEFKTYVPEYGPDNAIELAVREALDNGAGILLLPGYSFADVTVQLAAEYPERFFILLDVTEDDLREAAEDENYQVPENVYAAAYQEEQAGFLAGWAAVAMGCNKLAFLGGMAVPGVVRYGSGFVQGANAAAKALGRTEEVTVDYAYCNQFYPSETVEDYVTGWYENGVEVVFACGGGICWSAAAAAEACGGKLIGVDADQAAQLGESMTVTSAVKELGRTVTTQLDKLFADEFVGKAELLGITSEDPTQNYVGLARSTQWSESFTRDDYIALLGKIVSGEIEISDDIDERPQTEIFVDYNCYFGHEWGEPTYEWSADNSTVTAKRVCVNEDYHVETETVTTTSAVTVEPACLTAGERTYTAVFENTAFEKQTKTVPVQALGHYLVDHAAKAPTCTEKGWKAYQTCTRCDYTTYEEIAALGHDLVDHAAKAPTCTEKGWKAYQTCTRCDYTTYEELAALGHTIGAAVRENEKAPTCTEKGSYDEVVRCTVCQTELSREKKETAALGHDFGQWKQEKAPTCTEKGEESRKCSRCDEVEKRDVDALGHKPGEAVEENYFAPDCENFGGVDEVVRCTVCGEILSSNHVEYIPLGHDFGQWTQSKAPTCTEKGEETRKCSRCDETEKRDVAALGHKPGTAVRENEKAPTCTEKGSYDEVVRCTVCQTELSREKKETAALGHDFGEWKQEKAPTCTETGVEIRVCSRCDETEKRDVDKTAHTFVNGVCKVCGEKDPNYGPTISFVDVQEGAFYYDAVMWAVAHDPQITSGTDLTHFSPNNPCTRGQVVAFLWRASGCPEPKSTTHPFTDVKEGAFYYKAMLWAVENGITTGASKTTFAPNKPCTRGQVVTFLWRSVGSPEPQTTLHPFVDVKDSGFYYKAMLWAVENGITTGASKTAFAPDKTCTRGQVVTFLYRTYAKR